MRRLRSLAGANLAGTMSLAFLGLLVVVGLFPGWFAPHDPAAITGNRGAGPTLEHLFGTDELGRDILSRVIFGAGVVIEAIARALGLAIVIGVPLGMFLAYLGGWLDRLVMRLVDVLFSIPGIVLSLGIIAALGPGLENAMFAVGIGFATTYTRLTRGLVLAAREELYVDAARVGGAGAYVVLRRQILPNVIGPIIVHTTVLAGAVILIEAALSFLGVGLPPNEASWGGMLNSARGRLALYPFLPLAPGVAITLTVLAINTLGDSMRDSLGRDNQEHHLTGLVAGKLSVARSPRSDVQVGEVVLQVEHLEVRFPAGASGGDDLVILDDVGFDLRAGETLGLVGESGSGKTMTALAVMGLLPPGGRTTRGSIRLLGTDLLELDAESLRARQGRDLAMVFQEPTAALNPALSIGRQIAEPVRAHAKVSRSQAEDRAIELLATVGIPNPAQRAKDYPHQFSGGMAQRAMIAMALANQPSVLVADEPTTALDVTVQGQVVDLLKRLQAEMGMAILFITHDLGLVADVCDRAAVMYAGQIVEEAGVDELFASARHPYTALLHESMPRHRERRDRLVTIEGRVPGPDDWPSGCRFHPRCPDAKQQCATARVDLTVEHVDVSSHSVRCLRVDELDRGRAR